jgi:hypothetical protein
VAYGQCGTVKLAGIDAGHRPGTCSATQDLPMPCAKGFGIHAGMDSADAEGIFAFEA